MDCEQAALFDCEGTTTPVDVWVGEDGLVRRISLEEKSSSGAIEFFDFGVDVTIAPPPADQVEDLGAALGGRDCTPGFGRPILLTKALDAVRDHGFTVPTQVECTGSLAAFGNADAAGAFEREGQIHCFLLRSSASAAPTAVRREGADGADAELALHNLTCTILADSPTGEAKIDKLEAAFAELERQVRVRRLAGILERERLLESERRAVEVGGVVDVVDGKDRERFAKAHQRTREGAGSPCASSHETTGFRRTPIRSISHSMTSPGLR